MVHIVYCDNTGKKGERVLDRILSGEKTMVVRGAAVENYVKLTEDEINRVFSDNADALCLTPKQVDRWHKKCICLVAFSDVKPIAPPLAFDKQTNMDDWLIAEQVEDVVVGTSIPFNYDKAKL